MHLTRIRRDNDKEHSGETKEDEVDTECEQHIMLLVAWILRFDVLLEVSRARASHRQTREVLEAGV